MTRNSRLLLTAAASLIVYAAGSLSINAQSSNPQKGVIVMGKITAIGDGSITVSGFKMPMPEHKPGPHDKMPQRGEKNANNQNGQRGDWRPQAQAGRGPREFNGPAGQRPGFGRGPESHLQAERGKQPTEYTITLSDSTVLRGERGKAMNMSELQVGTSIQVRGADGDSVNATEIFKAGRRGEK